MNCFKRWSWGNDRFWTCSLPRGHHEQSLNNRMLGANGQEVPMNCQPSEEWLKNR